MQLKKHIPTITLLIITSMIGETAVDHLTLSFCDFLNKIKFNEHAIGVCDKNAFELAAQLFIAIVFGSACLFLLICGDAILSVRDKYFSRMEREIFDKYRFLPAGINISHQQDLNEILRELKLTIDYFTENSKTSISLFVLCQDRSEEARNVKMRQVYEITPDGHCGTPPHPAMFMFGQGFVGLAWKFRQVRIGQRKYFGFFRNRAYHKLRFQSEYKRNSFFCIPITKLSEKFVFSVVSIDSQRTNSFGLLSTGDHSYKEISGYIAKLLAPSIQTILYEEEIDSVNAIKEVQNDPI